MKTRFFYNCLPSPKALTNQLSAALFVACLSAASLWPTEIFPRPPVPALTCPEGLKINELRTFAKAGPAGDFLFSFVELYNAEDQDLPLKGWLLAGAQGAVIAELPDWNLPAHAFLMVYFGEGTDDDDFSDQTGTFYTQGGTAVFNPAGGEAGLYFEKISTANIRDFVAWSETGTYKGGTAYDHAVEAGIWPAEQFVDRVDADPLSSIGLLPDGNDNNQPADWQEYDWGANFIGVLPGGPNQPLLWPADEVVADSPVDTFQWRRVWNAPGYRLQLAFKSDFKKILLDTLLPDTQCRLALPEARYYWRVLPLLHGCILPAPPHRTYYVEEIAGPEGGPQGKKVKKYKYLGVGRILQRKDTRMLCISDENLPDWKNPIPKLRRPGCTEMAGRNGPWDGAHPLRHALKCPHCDMYCARAAIAMVNHFYKGDLSQDRISYQIHRDFFKGPEQDLGHHRPVYGQPDEISPAYAWALGGAAVQRTVGDLTYKTIVDEITAGRPILVLIPGHYVVVNGFRTRASGNQIYVSDPWPGRAHNGWQGFKGFKAVMYWTHQGNKITGAKEEATVKTDADSDGVVDFDEQNRFCSHFQKPDTDLDEVPDKKDIRSYTFHDVDTGHDNDAPQFPDIDGDGTYAECDCDADNDADFDGGEDINGDGKSPVGAGETDVFNPDDPVVTIATDKPVYFPGENVRLFGGTHHASSTYPYEIKSGCPDLVNGQPLGETGKVTTDAKGIYTRDLGGFAPGLYLVVLDILKDKRYQEPDNWDPWTCFWVVACSIVIDPFVIPASSSTAFDGAVDLTVNGGTPPYTFQWSNGATSEDLKEIPAGVYTVTVSNQEGCTQTAEIVVPACFMALSFVVFPVTIPGGSDGAIDLTVQGGTPPYTFQWSNGATSEDLFDLPSGPYFVEVRDAQGCIQFGETFVPEHADPGQAGRRGTAPGASIPQGLRIFPNPAREALTLKFDERPAEDWKVAVFDALGRMVRSGSIHAETEKVEIDLIGLTDGAYFLRLLEPAGQVWGWKFVKQRE